MILFNNERIQFHHFPNGETYIDKPFFAKHRATLRNVVTLKYESDDDIFKLFLVREALSYPCTLRITYFPYSRMDRESNSYTFTLKAVAKLINSMEWDHVLVYEPHSDVTPALLDRCEVINVIQRLAPMVRLSQYQVFYPDAGAQKRYAETFTTPDALIGFKHRDFETGKILSLEILGKRVTDTVVIVDDLCSKGETFVLAAEKLREMGFTKVVLVVAHCEKTILSGKVFSSGLIDEVLTTDSILDNRLYVSNLKVVPLSQL